MTAYIRQEVEKRASRIARKLGLSADDLIAGIKSYSAEITILGDATGNTKATACAGDATAAGDGTSGDHVNLEPNSTAVEYISLGLFNMNGTAETETWGRGDFFHGDDKVATDQQDSDSTFSQRRVNSLAFSVNSADAGMDSYPYMELPAATKDMGLKTCLYNIAGASAEQTAVVVQYFIPVPAGTWRPNPAGKPCACTTTSRTLR